MGLLVSLGLIVASVAVLLVGPARERVAGTGLRLALVMQALFAAGAGAYLIIYVAADDDYRDDGTSRWEAYSAQGFTVVAIVSAFLVSALAVSVLARTQSRGLWAVGLLGPVSASLVGAAFLANSLN